MGLECGKEDLPLIDENYVTLTDKGYLYSIPQRYTENKPPKTPVVKEKDK